MNASQLNKVNNLLTVGIPKKDREMRAHLGNLVYVEPMHIMMAKTTLKESPDTPHRYFIGTEEAKSLSGDPIRFCREHNKRSVISRKFLLEILQAMDSDNVIIYADEECPVAILGMMNHEMVIEGVIAPRICGDDVTNYPEGLYD